MESIAWVNTQHKMSVHTLLLIDYDEFMMYKLHINAQNFKVSKWLKSQVTNTML